MIPKFSYHPSDTEIEKRLEQNTKMSAMARESVLSLEPVFSLVLSWYLNSEIKCKADPVIPATFGIKIYLSSKLKCNSENGFDTNKFDSIHKSGIRFGYRTLMATAHAKSIVAVIRTPMFK